MAKEKDRAKIKKRTVLTARYITQVAVMAGLLTALKFALSFLPNVEVITLLIAVFSAVWGLKYSLPATLVFCTVEMAIYGIGTWVPLYFIYWPLLAVIFHFALRGKRPAVAMGIALAIALPMTIIFGVLSASVETLFVIGAVSADMLGTYFVTYYLKGLWYYLVHVVSVVASIAILFIPLVKICQKIHNGLVVVEGVDDSVEENITQETTLENNGENVVNLDDELSEDESDGAALTCDEEEI
ncbi:MAG: hypothetical protein J6V37_05095 [Clostridia bacterium]|nr:hypothetical protein [Clostridia bacterium]